MKRLIIGIPVGGLLWWAMVRAIQTAAVAAAGLMSSGCCSYLATQAYNNEATAINVVAQRDGTVQAGVNLLDPGYWDLWKNRPMMAAGATIGDLLIAAAVGLGVQAIAESGDSDDHHDPAPAEKPLPTQGVTATVSGDGNTVIQTITVNEAGE